jgi:hypothetical protein
LFDSPSAINLSMSFSRELSDSTIAEPGVCWGSD